VRGQKNEFHALEKCYNYFPQSTIKEIDIPASIGQLICQRHHQLTLTSDRPSLVLKSTRSHQFDLGLWLSSRAKPEHDFALEMPKVQSLELTMKKNFHKTCE
jgi:hypothetical protein